MCFIMSYSISSALWLQETFFQVNSLTEITQDWSYNCIHVKATWKFAVDEEDSNTSTMIEWELLILGSKGNIKKKSCFFSLFGLEKILSDTTRRPKVLNLIYYIFENWKRRWSLKGAHGK